MLPHLLAEMSNMISNPLYFEFNPSLQWDGELIMI